MKEKDLIDNVQIKKMLEDEGIDLDKYYDAVKEGKFKTYAMNESTGQMELFHVTGHDRDTDTLEGYFLSEMT